MTLQEVSKLLGKSEVTLYKNFKRTQQTLAKKGIILSREGKGEYVSYSVKYEKEEN